MIHFDKIKCLVFSILMIITAQVFGQQALKTLKITKAEVKSTTVPVQCKPGNMIIIINSTVPDLKFESNMLADTEFMVSYNRDANQYYICHEKMKFILTVSCPNAPSKTIDIGELGKPIAYNVVLSVASSKLTIIADPKNAKVVFHDLNDLTKAANEPIVNLIGKFNVTISKPQYKTLDTVLVIPADSEVVYRINLVPLFSMIKLSLTTDGNIPFAKAPVLWLDSAKLQLDAVVTPGMNQRSFLNDVVYGQLYEGNIIPLKEGRYNVRIEADGYIPYKTTVDTKDGSVNYLSVSLEPLYGTLTFVDKKWAEGADVILDGQNLGKMPLGKIKSKVGRHVVSISKPGYSALQDVYTAVVTENKNTDVVLQMDLSRNINFTSDQNETEVFMDGAKIGSTPFSYVMHSGKHSFVMRKNGFATEKFYKAITESTVDGETVNLKPHPVYPLAIRSESDSLLIKLTGLNDLSNIVIDSTVRTPRALMVPYGKYKISLKNNWQTVYRSSLVHAANIGKREKLPNYSWMSFDALALNYTDQNDFEGAIGRADFFHLLDYRLQS